MEETPVWKRYREQKAELRQRLQELDELQSEPKSSGPSDLRRAKESALAAQIARLRASMQAIESRIERIPDARVRVFLRYRCLMGKTLEETAEQMHYSRETICRINRLAKQTLAKERR